MNIFVLDSHIEDCAKFHVDKHVVKMITEYNQLLSSAYYYTGYVPEGVYKLTHRNHPCAIWTRESLTNWCFLCALNYALCREYTYRYGKIHKGESILRGMPLPDIKDIGFTPMPEAMPYECKDLNAVTAYRNYYNKYKRHLFSWKGREVPYWISKS